MIERWIKEDLLTALRSRRGVHLTGARQSGKTTLSAMLNITKVRRRSLDDESLIMAAKLSPWEFSRRANGETFIIDEIQKVPELLNAIKMHVDEDTERAQYLLTGSSNLRFGKMIKDSLAGRFATVRLHTLAAAEINGRRPDFFERIFRGDFPDGTTSFGKADAIRAAFTGGYPEQLELSTKERRRWFKDYLNDLLTKDVKDITEIRKMDTLQSVAEWLLSHSAQFFTIEDLCAKTGISKVTAENYMEALRALYLFDKIPAWNKGDYDRIGKRAKWMAADTGMIANILKWNEDDMMTDPRAGKMLESWVGHELQVQADANGEYELNHYRDRHGHEIDFIVKDEAGNELGIEVKAGAAVGPGDFRHLQWFAKNMAQKKFTGVVLHTGREVLSFGEGFYAVPFGMLAGYMQ